ncbi:MAG: hypothetical protein EXR47_03240 [Dehalococcoidia bacterium]|nr:hypothetical protein [Dehalococcoidia bacterium]
MKADPWRIAAYCTVAAIGILVLLLAILWPARLPGLLAVTTDPETLLRPLPLSQRIVWTLSNGLYGLYFFLFVPLIWMVFQTMKSESPLEAAIAFPIAVVAIVAEGLGRWWHPVFETPLVAVYHASGDPEARRSLEELLLRYDSYHQMLHYLTYIMVVWAVLLLVASLKHKSLPLWLSLLAFTMVVAVGTFPPAAIVWAVPALLVVKAHSERASSDGARAGRRGGASAPSGGLRRKLQPARRG